MPSPQDREAALFALAVEKPVAERAAFLQAVCGADGALRQRLEVLLSAHDQPDELIGDDASDPTVKATIKLDLADAPDEAVGQTLGRYKLLERVGEGGCGVVYVAEQTEPVRRRVALKVIKLGMDTKQVVARFEAERQALAMMDHPNIAKVLDAGTTDVGRPFFVMELVRGIKITDYCDQANLTTQDRLDLFIKVCQAIQHAHQKGIIHRDIKPSNILVTLHDGVPVPKVIDFGIAKATEGRLTDNTVYTQLHQFIGTPAYMSPEQAEMSGLDIDTRSDIYSLGVLLYELLTGSTPFDAEELMASGLDAMRKTIREKEPQRPSTRLATLGADQLTTTAKRRSADTSKLMHQLKGDLDWIVMKCLEKDRTRRYDTANGLAADLKRHLNNEPVLARPPSTAYRFQKAFRRNKLAFAAAAAVALVLTLGVIAATWQAVRARKAEIAARQELENAHSALAFIQDDLLGLASPDRQPNPDLTARTMLDRASLQLDRPPVRPPVVEAALRQTIGSVYTDLGEYTRSIGHLERALAIRSEHLGAAHPETLRTLATLGTTHWWNGDDPKALELAREGLERSRRALGETNLVTLQFLAALATARVYEEVGAPEGTERLVLDAVRLSRDTLGETHPLVFQLAITRALHHQRQGQFALAQSVISAALEQHRGVLLETHPQMIFATVTLATSLFGQAKFDAAEPLLLRARDLRRSVLGTNHPMTLATEIVVAQVYVSREDTAQADRLHQRLLDLLGEGRLVESRFAVRSLVNLVDLHRSRKDWAKADALAAAVLAAGRKQFGGESLKVVVLHDQFGQSLMEQGRHAEAEPHFRAALAIRERHAPNYGRRFATMSWLGACRFKQGDHSAEVEQWLLRGAQETSRRFPEIPAGVRLRVASNALQPLIQFYEATGRPADAARWKQQYAEFEKHGSAVTGIIQSQ